MIFPSTSRANVAGYCECEVGPRVDLVHDLSIPEGRRVCVLPEHFFVVCCFAVPSSSAAVDQHRRERDVLYVPENYYASVGHSV